MKYYNYKNVEVDTESLSDEELVSIYRFFSKYSKITNNLSKETFGDTEYKKYIDNILAITNNIQLEIKNMKLKLNRFK